MLSMAHPKAFLPVHGEATHLRAHADLAAATGVPPENIFILENGDVLELSSNGIKQIEPVQSGIVFVDGLTVGDTSQDVLNDRSKLGEVGFASVSAVVSPASKHLSGDVQLEMRGITGGDDKEIANAAKSAISSSIRRGLERGASIKEIEKIARDALLSILWERTRQRPVVVVNIHEI